MWRLSHGELLACEIEENRQTLDTQEGVSGHCSCGGTQLGSRSEACSDKLVVCLTWQFKLPEKGPPIIDGVGQKV